MAVVVGWVADRDGLAVLELEAVELEAVELEAVEPEAAEPEVETDGELFVGGKLEIKGGGWVIGAV